MNQTPAYDALRARRLQIYNLEAVQAIASWDRMTFMPAGSGSARAAAQAELAALIQTLQTSEELDGLAARAASEPLNADDRTNLKLMERERLVAAAVPEALNTRRSHAVAAASDAWRQARAANDWALFSGPLSTLVEVVRESAQRLGDALGLSRYDALLDGHDRGLNRAQVEQWFGEIGQWLPGIVASITAQQAAEEVLIPQGPFPQEGQRQACLAAMTALGFDFERGRLDVSAHPFTGGTPDDVRLTTRYTEDECLSALLGVIHEAGHGRYQAGLPGTWRGQPLGEPCSASMHEAQALAFERQLARSPAFVQVLSEILQTYLGPQPAFEPRILHRLMTRVRPGAIRVDADEVTYPAHVILRTEIEIALIEGEIEAGDVPALWDQRMLDLLGVDVRGNPAQGPLQYIHWSMGMFGYFPAYLIGAMAAAQLFQSFTASTGAAALDQSSGTELSRALGEWLEDKVWRHGAAMTTGELIASATGQPLSPTALNDHFQRRYAGA